MTDRLKFRVWDKYFNRYWTDEEVKNNIQWLLYPNNENIENVVIEQCTGLKDKNGKLIYESDIVKITDRSSRAEPFVGVVEYTNTASFEANCKGFYMYLHNLKTPENVSTVEKMFCSSLREIEVIGNIHENPEFLNADNA